MDSKYTSIRASAMFDNSYKYQIHKTIYLQRDYWNNKNIISKVWDVVSIVQV